jgi:primosomal protein N'
VIQTIAVQEESVFVIGMRSALLLADMQHFGLVIVDEENDFAYKQNDPAPRFQARDLALFIGKHYNIPVVLGTSSPSLESEYNVRSGKYPTVSLDTNTLTKPNIEIVDTLKLRKKKQMNGSLSYPLLSMMESVLSCEKQALFFTQRPAQLQEELNVLFPAVRTARLDETHSLHALQHTLSLFKEGKIDILLCVQTVYKSINWANLSLVVIFDADKQLSRTDFRAHERTFQMLMTIFGCLDSLPLRTLPRMVIQTEQSDHPFYQFLQQNNRETFVVEQLSERKEYHYPPFVRLIAIRFKHPNAENALEAALQFKQELSNIGITAITGPFAPRQHQDATLHTQLLWIHLQRHSDNHTLKKKIHEKATTYKFLRGYIQVDVDPY